MTIKDKSPKQVLEDAVNSKRQDWAESRSYEPHAVGDYEPVVIPFWAAVAILSALDRP